MAREALNEKVAGISHLEPRLCSPVPTLLRGSL